MDSAPFICPSISTWRKSAIVETPEEFFCRGETHAAHLARHPSPLHGKNRAKWHHLQKIFSARESSSNVQNRAFWKPLSELFWNYFARVSAAIDHPCESCHRHLLSAGPYCPLPSYVKIRAKWKHFLKIFWITAFNIVFRGYCLHTGSSPFVYSSISTWRKSAILETPEQIFLPAWSSCCKLPYTLTCQKSSKVTPAKSNFVADVTMLDRIKIAPRQFTPQGW